MTDYSAIAAFCLARIDRLDRQIEVSFGVAVPLLISRRDELTSIVTLIKGLNQQEKMLEEALGLNFQVREVSNER